MQQCPVVIQVYAYDQSSKKHGTYLFTVHTIGEKNHDSKKEIAARPVTGLAREKIGITIALFFMHYFWKK
jgi:hypothetical protein